MTVQIMAMIYLLIRFTSLWFISMVLKRQLRLFRLKIDTELIQFRMVMFLLGIVFFTSMILPIVVDFYYAFINTDARWNTLLVSYAATNSITGLVGSVLLWNVYRIAGNELDEKEKRDGRRISRSR